MTLDFMSHSYTQFFMTVIFGFFLQIFLIGKDLFQVDYIYIIGIICKVNISKLSQQACLKYSDKSGFIFISIAPSLRICYFLMSFFNIKNLLITFYL